LARHDPEGAKLADIRNNEVVKFEGSAAATVARTLLQAGPATATDVAQTLGAFDTGSHIAVHINFDMIPGHRTEIFALFE
jgi:hypothetical protein